MQQPARILDVGNCRPDHFAIKRLVQSMGADVDQAHHLEDTMAALNEKTYRLVLVNRKLDADYSDGMDIIRAIRSRREFDHIPVMMISNYPHAQAEAMEAGAVRGFGKLELSHPRTREVLLDAIKNRSA